MTFPQRVANSLIALAFSKVRDLFVYEKLETIIDQKFPDEPRSSRPSLDELEHGAGLVLQVCIECGSMVDFHAILGHRQKPTNKLSKFGILGL